MARRGRYIRQISRGGGPVFRYVAFVAILALVLRLSWPVQPSLDLETAPADPVLLFGEHALCLANAAGELPQPAPAPHANHDKAGCCLAHGSASPALPPIVAAEPVAFAEIGPTTAFDAAAAPAAALRGRFRARAPPLRA